MKLDLEAKFCRALIDAKIKHPAFKDRENFHSHVNINPLDMKDKDREIFLKVLSSNDFQKGEGSSKYKAIRRSCAQET